MLLMCPSPIPSVFVLPYRGLRREFEKMLFHSFAKITAALQLMSHVPERNDLYIRSPTRIVLLKPSVASRNRVAEFIVKNPFRFSDPAVSPGSQPYDPEFQAT